MKWSAQICSAGTVRRAQSVASDGAGHLDMLVLIFSRRCIFLNAIIQPIHRLTEDVGLLVQDRPLPMNLQVPAKTYSKFAWAISQ